MKLLSIAPNLYRFTDTCNVYVLKDGDAALLIDFGDGGVMKHLPEIGVKTVEWVLFTHHHREQLQGWHNHVPKDAKTAAPELERNLFEKPSDFRKVNVTLGDQFTVHGASFVRPPILPIPLDRGFKTMDSFTWRGREFWCVDTRGNSPGGMSYLLKTDAGWLAFSGDVMVSGAKLHNWFDSEWDYGFGAGVYAMHNAAAVVEQYHPSLLLPSHGPEVKNPAPELRRLREKLRALTPHYLRGWEVNTFAAGDQDPVSKPTAVPHVWQVTPHLYKFKGPNFWPNFSIIIADSGRGLVVDCGLMGAEFLDQAIKGMKERLGLKGIDVLFVTHAHGDHFLEAEHLRKAHAAKLWTMDGVHPPCEHPERFEFPAPIQSYGSSIQRGIKGVKFDKLLATGSSFQWEGFSFNVDWMPGQTKYACCLHGMIDGKRIAFTGDNVFANPADPNQGGNECIVARNDCILEESYIYAADYLHTIAPDLLIGGHSWVMANPAKLIERLRTKATAARDGFRGLSTDPEYRYFFDPFWVRADPYRVPVSAGKSAKFDVLVRNFRDRPQKHRIELHAPPGLSAKPGVLEGTVAAGQTGRFPVELVADAGIAPGVRIVAFDITLDGHRHGELFDFIAIV